MGLTIRLLLAVAAFAYAADGAAAQWKQLQKGAAGELWVDNASVKRNDGEAAFEYRIDFPKPQKVSESKDMYRSTVTRAIVRCAVRAISIGPAVAYGGTRGTGKMVGNFPPSPEEARFQPVERNSSDETLLNHVCKIAKLIPQK